MAFAKIINLFAISSLAVLICSLGTTPVNALSDGHHMVRSVKRSHGHDVVAKHKRSSKGRCKSKSTTSAVATSTSTSVKTTPTSSKSSSSAKATQTSKSSGSSSGSSSGGSSSSSSSGSTGGGSSSTQFTSPGSGKVGLAWPQGLDNLDNFVTSHTKFIYNWGPSCLEGASKLGLTCMPMLWSDDGSKVAAFTSQVKEGYAKIAMGFNEVNEGGQANMSPQQAVTAWQKYLNPLHDQGYTLISPSTSSNPNGGPWMQEFFKLCSEQGGCHVDALSLHFYDTSVDSFINYIEEWHSNFSLPVYVTEFACQNFNTANENNGQQCSESQIQAFYSKAIQFMESTDYVVSYFPFGFMTEMQGVNDLDRLMTTNGEQPTSLGSQVIHVSW